MAHNDSIDAVVSTAVYCVNTCWTQCIDATFSLKIARIASNEKGFAMVRDLKNVCPNKCHIELQMLIVIPSAPLLQNPLLAVVILSVR
jgi:hypothetical protein